MFDLMHFVFIFYFFRNKLSTCFTNRSIKLRCINYKNFFFFFFFFCYRIYFSIVGFIVFRRSLIISLSIKQIFIFFFCLSICGLVFVYHVSNFKSNWKFIFSFQKSKEKRFKLELVVIAKKKMRKKRLFDEPTRFVLWFFLFYVGLL